MDKIFNFFSSSKSKAEIEKQKRNTVINTQNLHNLANVNISSLNNNNNTEYNNYSSGNKDFSEADHKTINFTSQDFENIDTILKQKNENNISSNSKTENNLSEKNNVNSLISSGEFHTGNPLDIPGVSQAAPNFMFNNNNNSIGNSKSPNSLVNKPAAVGDVVTVNSIENIKKPSDGFYTKKYSEQIANLKSV